MTDAPLPNFDPLDPDHVRDSFLEKIAPARERFEQLKGAHGRAPETVDNEQALSAYATHVKAMKECAKVFEAARREEKGRYDACGKVVHGAAMKFIDDLKKWAGEAESRMTAYQRRVAEEERKRREERERKEREEAERLAKEAAYKAAALQSEEDLDKALAAEEEAKRAAEAADKARREAEATAAEMHRTRGEYGGVGSLRSVLSFEITDAFLIPPQALWTYIDMAAKEKAIRAYMKANSDTVKKAVKEGTGEKVIPGVRFFEDVKTTVR